jgi:hypothetical protein
VALRERPERLGSHSGDEVDWARAPRGWRRQYVGIVRQGRRFIYGNYFRHEPSQDAIFGDDWRRESTRVCDGGPVFFGVEYDVEAQRFTHIAFNGAI